MDHRDRCDPIAAIKQVASIPVHVACSSAL
jgi:hypothetical protein